MAKIHRALIAYSILKDQLERGDLYEGLMVFFRPITGSLSNTQFIPLSFSEQLEDKYGLNVPATVIESLTEKMLAAGLIFKYAEKNSAVSYRYSEQEPVITNVSLPLINELLEDFKQFTKNQPTVLTNLSDVDLEQAFFDRLLHIESLQIFSRKDGLYSQKRTPQTITKLKSATHSSNQNSMETHLDYVVSRYILELQLKDEAKFNFLSDVATANLAAETLLSYRDPPKKGEDFDELVIYLDAPLCLDILGVNVGKQQFGNELAAALKNSECKVHIFLHSIIEIERVLEARKQSYFSGINPIGRNQVDPPEIQNLVKALAGYSEQILTEVHGFQIIDSFDAIPASRRGSVGAEQEKIIRDQLTGWNSEAGRDVDISTCCDLIRLRSAIEVPTRILKSGVILVSRNSTLVRAANMAWKQWLAERRTGIDRVKKAAPLAIIDKHLIGLLWITQGGESGRLGRSHLIANCAAAISTKKDVITKVYNTLIDSSPQAAAVFEAIINDQRAERALMNLTYGDSELITDENVLPLLDKLRLETAKKVEDEKNEEILRLKSEYDQLIKQNIETIAQLEIDKGLAVTANQKFQNHENARIQQQESISLTLLNQAFRHACRAFKIITFLIVLVVTAIIYGLLLYIPIPVLDNLTSNLIKFLISLLAGGFIFAWDIPEILFSKIRNTVCLTVLNYFCVKGNIKDMSNLYHFNFKDKIMTRN